MHSDVNVFSLRSLPFICCTFSNWVFIAVVLRSLFFVLFFCRILSFPLPFLRIYSYFSVHSSTTATHHSAEKIPFECICRFYCFAWVSYLCQCSDVWFNYEIYERVLVGLLRLYLLYFSLSITFSPLENILPMLLLWHSTDGWFFLFSFLVRSRTVAVRSLTTDSSFTSMPKIILEKKSKLNSVSTTKCVLAIERYLFHCDIHFRRIEFFNLILTVK